MSHDLINLISKQKLYFLKKKLCLLDHAQNLVVASLLARLFLKKSHIFYQFFISLYIFIDFMNWKSQIWTPLQLLHWLSADLFKSKKSTECKLNNARVVIFGEFLKPNLANNKAIAVICMKNTTFCNNLNNKGVC